MKNLKRFFSIIEKNHFHFFHIFCDFFHKFFKKKKKVFLAIIFFICFFRDFFREKFADRKFCQKVSNEDFFFLILGHSFVRDVECLVENSKHFFKFL
jgi:hypothetical protein